jgi:hypothetical protein
MNLLLDELVDARASEDRVAWPTLASTQLSAEDRKLRLCGLGGSDANVLMSGDRERILRLWQLKRQEVPEEDLSDRLQVALGSWTEPFNRQWYEKLTGQVVIDAGRSITCKRHPWRRCLLDGIVEESNAVFEAKHTVPVAPPVPLPPKPIGIREVCLEGSNSWASAAVDWLEHREAAKRHASACGTIKGLVEADVARAFGHGIEAKRSKSGALSIRELGQ